jgi:hypothetical protein
MKTMSTITLQLSSDLEQQLRSAATAQGIEPDIYRKAGGKPLASAMGMNAAATLVA